MEPRLSLVTLGVADLNRAKAFYTALGWTAAPLASDDVVFFQLGPLVLALFGADNLAADAGVPADGTGFRSVALAWNGRSAAEVDAAFASAIAAGATPVKRPQQAPWGGYSGYFADPDGHLWELAYNPGFHLGEDVALVVPT